MPLIAKILRDGELVKMPNGWGSFHLSAMIIASSVDSGRGAFTDNTCEAVLGAPYESLTEPTDITPDMTLPLSMRISSTPLNEGRYVLQRAYSFRDAVDGEILTLQPGDELLAYRA